MPSFAFRPCVQELENRLSPAVMVTPFASVPGGQDDSYLIRGTAKRDVIQITDDPGGAGFSVTNRGKLLSLPAINSAEPVVVRVRLLDGDDQLDYLVPNAVTLVRQLEFVSGGGENRVLLNNTTENDPGVVLLAGSNLDIDFKGGRGRFASGRAVFGDITASTVNVDFHCGDGNDNVSVDAHGDIGGDSTLMVNADLGDGTDRPGPRPANRFGVSLSPYTNTQSVYGVGDTVGTVIDVNVQGGPDLEQIFIVVKGTLGNGLAPASLAVTANLGAARDRVGLFLTELTVRDHASLQIAANTGGGNDELYGLGFLNSLYIHDNALVDVSFSGGAGNDQVRIYNGVMRVRFLGNGLFRLRLDGGDGRDEVHAELRTTDSDPTGTLDIQVHGGRGRDIVGLSIDDPVGVVYAGGAALLDGGLGNNGLHPTGAVGNVQVFNV